MLQQEFCLSSRDEHPAYTGVGCYSLSARWRLRRGLERQQSQQRSRPGCLWLMAVVISGHIAASDLFNTDVKEAVRSFWV